MAASSRAPWRQMCETRGVGQAAYHLGTIAAVPYASDVAVPYASDVKGRGNHETGTHGSFPKPTSTNRPAQALVCRPFSGQGSASSPTPAPVYLGTPTPWRLCRRERGARSVRVTW